MRTYFKKIISKLTYYILHIIENIGINIRFAKIAASRIGHLLTNIDQSIYFLDTNKKNYFLFIYLSGKISNKYAVLTWKNHKKIFFLKFVKKIIELSNYNLKLKNFILDWDIIQPGFTKLYSSRKNFIIKQKEIDLFKKNQYLKKEFICLHNRDNFFTKNIVNDTNYLEYKNFAFEDFKSTIDQIHRDNFIPIRIGKFVEKKNIDQNLSYIDKTGDKSDDKLDIFLQYFAKFTIIGSTGLAAIATTLRKPCLYINYLPLTLGQLSWVSKNSMILPKLVQSEKDGKLLRFSELAEIDFNIHQKDNFLSEEKLKVINNTEQEILEAYKEMKIFVSNSSHSSENFELNHVFFNSFRNKDYGNYLLNETQLRVPSFFLKKYINLI